ncbi:hypothetical protein I0C86_12575 [Plantactinospora sp. S1510]|uniref:DUF4383 domain-containing protein n=1 Tax=Plantactinospora alkalitolerans TaxID=2789879 RepID=A0ABS0GUV2_9ACTN|nr:DUF6069 family protein [Plantactinospora alkalitolerans]MBF9129788.1 hypothetical protein [Plantactinospora alkalitolerans]
MTATAITRPNTTSQPNTDSQPDNTIRPAATARSGRQVRRFRLLAVGAAVLANATLYSVAHAVGTDFVLTAPNNPVPHPLILAEIVGITLVFSLLGWGTLALLERFTRRARVIWGSLATALLALSFVPLGIELATVDTKVMLGLMHLVVAAALFPMLRQTTARR